MSVATLPPPPHHPSRPQLPPPLLHAQANPPFVNPNCFPNLHYFFPPYQIPFQQPCYWPSQFGQYIPHHTSTQPSLLPQNLNPPKLPPSSTDTSHSSQTKPSPSHGERGNSAFFLHWHKGLLLLTKDVWILIPLLKNRASTMVLFGLVDRVWIGSLHAW